MEDIIGAVKAWAEHTCCVEGVIVVGSYARGTYTETSDLDLCIITTCPAQMIEHQDFVALFGDVEKTQTEYYGACTSIRVWYRDRREVEFGIVAPSWAAIPLDAGTRTVLRGGYRVILDKKQYFRDLSLY